MENLCVRHNNSRARKELNTRMREEYLLFPRGSPILAIVSLFSLILLCIFLYILLYYLILFNIHTCVYRHVNHTIADWDWDCVPLITVILSFLFRYRLLIITIDFQRHFLGSESLNRVPINFTMPVFAFLSVIKLKH